MTRLLLLALLGAGLATPVRADVTLGALLSLTGPVAGIGQPERNTIALLPTTTAGQAIRRVVLDDASDTTAAVRAARKLEEHVDAILGASTTPASIAILGVIAARVQTVSLAGSSAAIEPPEGPAALVGQTDPERTGRDRRHRRPHAGHRTAHAGSRSLFGATLWDAFPMIEAAIPAALRTRPPGTPGFRTESRGAMEQTQGLALSEAVFSLTPSDHGGAQADSQVMVEIRAGAYHLLSKEP